MNSRESSRGGASAADLVFVGIKGSVIALDRATGEQVWATHLSGWSFVNVLARDGFVLASCNGEVFCLDPLTGNGRWHNPLKGFGTGLATLATVESPTDDTLTALAEKRRQDDQAAHAAAAT